MNDDKEIIIEFWDTAGQSKFDNLHECYFFEAHGAIFAFDTSRVVTYKNIANWYKKFKTFCPKTPFVTMGNKIDLDKSSTERVYPLIEKMGCNFYLTSAADGTNIVAVRNKFKIDV